MEIFCSKNLPHTCPVFTENASSKEGASYMTWETVNLGSTNPARLLKSQINLISSVKLLYHHYIDHNHRWM